MKKHLVKIAAVLATSLIAVGMFAMCTSQNSPEFDNPVKLTIIHINDVHGRTHAEPYISQMANKLKANGENVLILDAGDRLHGQIAANLSKGESMIEVMNAVDYNAMVPGNHDFNYGIDKLKELSEKMFFPILAANIKDASGANLFESYRIFNMSGVKVGVFGIISPETVTKTDPRVTAGLSFDDPATVAAIMVNALNIQNCDIIIALTHLGNDDASLFINRSAALVAVGGIDIIIDGHSHENLENGRVIDNTLIMQAGEHGQFIGIIEVTILNGKVISKTAKTVAVPIDGKKTELIPGEAIVAKIAEEEAKVAATASEVVGHTPVLLKGARTDVRTRETNLTNLITGSMLPATNADISFITGGNIRGSIEAGDITMGDVLTVLPFSNLLVTLELDGANVMKILEHGVSDYPAESAIFIHVAGIKFAFDPAAELGKRVRTAVLSDGSALEPNKTYTVATIEFLAHGGDGYDMLMNGKNLIYYGSDADEFADYLRSNPIIESEAEGRVTVLVEAYQKN